MHRVRSPFGRNNIGINMHPTNKSTDLLTADAILVTGKAILTGVNIITDKTNDVTLVLYDALSATGTVLFKCQVVGTVDSQYFELPQGGCRADIGIYADVTGTGAEFIVHYR